ncbi:MAG: magnesium transporter CorA family protein [Sphingomicrobium sp.]
MLRVFGPGCGGKIIDATREKIPAKASWIDLEEPTEAEEALVERCLGIDIPTHAELAEIEPSSRLYERDGALFMTISALTGVTEGEPTTVPIGFVLAGKRLVTVRHATPKPILAFLDHAQREPDLVKDGPTALLRLLDALVDRLADELEVAAAEMEVISTSVFARKLEARRIKADELTQRLTQVGRTQTLVARARYSAVTTGRMLSFLLGSGMWSEGKHRAQRNHLESIAVDARALTEHASFLTDSLTFLLDATLGLISIEQNAAMKLFSWVAAVFLPPSVVAGFFGMNFHYFPALAWAPGSHAGLIIMIGSAILPYAYFKWRRWI